MYTIKVSSGAYFVSTRVGRSPYFVSHDAPKSSNKGQNLLTQYLSDARTIFKSECDILLDTGRVFTDTDSDRLIIMLKLLIDARKTWQEEELARK
ncbi:MAG: hypothetical protein WCG55_00480 [bacterium]